MTDVKTIKAEEYWTTKKDVKLWVYRKYSGEPNAPRPILFLVHLSLIHI